MQGVQQGSPPSTLLFNKEGEKARCSQQWGIHLTSGVHCLTPSPILQPSTGCSPQDGYISYPTDPQHQSSADVASWGQTPSQLGVYLPEYHQVVQSSSSAPHLPGVKMEPDLYQPFHIQAMTDWNYPSVPLCSTEYQAFDFRSQTQDSYIQGQTESQKKSAQYFKQLALQEAFAKIIVFQPIINMGRILQEILDLCPR